MSPQLPSAPLRDLVEESFDEATFLWRRWEAELTSLTRNLAEVLSWTEGRLHGALDGVRAGGDAGLSLAHEALLSDDASRMTVGAAILVSSTDPTAHAHLAAALNPEQVARFDAALRALEVTGSPEGLRSAAIALRGASPELAGGLCRLKTFRRSAPAEELVLAFKSEQADVRLEAARLARHLPASPAAEPLVAKALGDSDARIAVAAAESALCLGLPQAWPAIAQRAVKPDAAAAPYLRLVALLGKPEQHEAIFAALPVDDLRLPAIWALGHIGTPRAVDACIAGMRHEALARAAAEAYCWITGANLYQDGLAAVETPAEVPEFEDDDLDANLVPAPEALWPLPDVDAVMRHWLARRDTFADNVRHIGGKPVSAETLLEQIEDGPMIRRADLAFEVRVRTRGKYDVETRAFAARQRQMMAAGRARIGEAVR